MNKLIIAPIYNIILKVNYAFVLSKGISPLLLVSDFPNLILSFKDVDFLSRDPPQVRL